MSTVLNPPKLTWFPDNGQPPPGHNNRLEEVKAINDWIIEFNDSYGKYTPRFHRFGVKTGRRFVGGTPVAYKVHQWNQWRQTEAMDNMIHLSDEWRIRMGGAVVRHFNGELQREGVLG